MSRSNSGKVAPLEHELRARCDAGAVGPPPKVKINIKNAEKVSAINKAFAEVQQEIRQLSQGTTAEPQKTQQVSTNAEEEPANVDAATSLLSQL